jgi:hypothetical protein
MSFPGRLPFGSLPVAVSSALEGELGAQITGWSDCQGGWSPAVAAVLRLSDGREVFAKVISAEVSRSSTELFDRELEVLPLLGAHVPHARFIGELRLGPWRGVITEAVPGGPPGPPWTTESVDRTLAALDALGTAPSGLPEPPDHSSDWNGWRGLAARDRSGLDAWERDRIEALAGLESGWETWTMGDSLVHCDVRGDNAVLGPDGVRLVDWAFGTSGPAWMNRAGLAVEVMATGSLELALRCLLGCPPEAGWMAIVLAGMWRRNSERPPHPGMPTHRAWQRRRADSLRPLLDAVLIQNAARLGR